VAWKHETDIKGWTQIGGLWDDGSIK
jgi:hypothetical protein